MAELLICDGDKMHVEMTENDWRIKHKDFKSESNEPKRCLFLVANSGSCSLPVVIVKEQNLKRRLKKDVRNHYYDKIPAGTEVTITHQGQYTAVCQTFLGKVDIKLEDLEVA
jgi:hypothetical protein